MEGKNCAVSEFDRFYDEGRVYKSIFQGVLMNVYTRFHSLEELVQVMETYRGRPFDDERVMWNPAEKQLEIWFNNVEGKTAIDEDDKERELYTRLLLNGVEEFAVEENNNGLPYRFRGIESLGDERYRLMLENGRWLVTFSGEPWGEVSEVIDDTDFEFSFSFSTLLAGLSILIVLVGMLRWLF